MTITTDLAPLPMPVVERSGATPAPWRRVLDILSTILTAIVVMVAAVTIVISIATHVSAPGGYTVFGHPVMEVLSGSMTPAIRTGDLVVDDRVSASQAQHLHVGQVVSFFDQPGSSKVLTHRIVAVRSVDGRVAYVTKGDANNAPDTSPRLASQVIATYSFKISRGAYILTALHRPMVLGLLLASPVLWFFSAQLFAWAKEEDDDERRGREPAGGAGEKGGAMA